jgi:hypothetical protein
MRICKKCEIEKDITEYYLKKNGKIRSSYCKLCYKIVYKTEYDKEYYENNKEKFKENYKLWYEENDRTEYRKKYWSDNSDKLKSNQKEFRENNKELVAKRKRDYWKSLSPEKKREFNEKRKRQYHESNYKKRKLDYINEKLKNDEFFKLKFNIRTLIRNSIKRGYSSKSKKTIEILGCSFEEFKSHLESLFDDRMNWENQGTYWHIDHIIPISSAKTEEDVYNLNHYTNLQPLYWLDNLKKSNKIDKK